MRFESLIPLEYFDVNHSSKNRTYFEVTPKKVGKAVLKSKFVAVVDQGGVSHESTSKVAGEQSVQIVDPVRITPSEVVLPYLPRRRTSFSLKATGGSGLYDWKVADTTICSVDGNGVLSGASTGTTTVTALDKRNPVHMDVANVHVMDIISLTFGETRKEAEVGSDLVLNVQLLGSGPTGSVPFTDCRAADFRVVSSDNEAPARLPFVGTGCSTVTLKAVSSGDAKVTVFHGKYEATLDVSSYVPLKVVNDDLAMGTGSSTSVHFEGGPRPWILDPSNHYNEASTDALVTTSIFDDVLNIKCGADDGTSTVRLQVGNKPSSVLPLPAVTTVDVAICCARPSRLMLSPLQGNHPKCPSNVKVLLNDASMNLELKAHASCKKGGDRLLDSISGFSVLWNEVAALGSVKLVHGSGHFAVHDLPGAPFTTTVTGNSVTVTPRLQGAGSLRIQDICVGGEFLDVPVKITDIHSLVIYGPQFMEMGSESEITVDAVDEAGILFSRDHGALANTVIESSDTSVHISKISGAHYRVRALSVGTISIKASSPSASGRTLTSRPHSIQVFSPLVLLPQIVTLIPESVFQLEVLGGPQPSPHISFALNNSKIATVESNALIRSKNLGYTSITGSVNVGGEQSTENTVVLRVVSLAGIRAIASTQLTEIGGRVCVRVNGLDETETPFAFGGAEYPFKYDVFFLRVKRALLSQVTWTVSHPDVLKMVHPLGTSVSEVDENRFAVCFEGESGGSATVKSLLIDPKDEIQVRVEASPHHKQHFVGSERAFEDTVEVRVEEPLRMHQPEMPIPSIRLAQNAQMQLETAWPQSVVEYSVPAEYSSRLSVTKSGLLKAKSISGAAVVIVRRTDLPDNETSVVPVTVSVVDSLDVVLLTKLEPVTSSPLLYLPVGVKVELQVVFRDSRGRQLSSSSSSISYRPHRFDLTEIVAANANRTLTVTMKSAGETVLMVWNSAAPSQSVFVRLSASEQLYPSNRQPTVSDIVCFASPLAGSMRWSSSDDRIEWLDARQGLAKLSQHGSTHVAVNVADQKLTTSLLIRNAEQMQFVEDQPSFVTNAEEASFVFPVNIASNETMLSQMGMTGCTEDQLAALTSIRAPFECILSFTNSKTVPVVNVLSVRAVFLPRAHSYGCVVQRQDAGYVRVDIAAAAQTDLQVTARWLGDSQVRLFD
ncbi:unnamed protein product [Heligmosomoides polygyrus]|uniref:BIG2 domain-containing protein n=1 Tax=Heligmosomoides polygyrus TaxID=6339 RepID=A0A3P8DR35_HELPZ|nr:unnamed protein product [Heligmosomoides polygyrus]